MYKVVFVLKKYQLHPTKMENSRINVMRFTRKKSKFSLLVYFSPFYSDISDILTKQNKIVLKFISDITFKTLKNIDSTQSYVILKLRDWMWKIFGHYADF